MKTNFLEVRYCWTCFGRASDFSHVVLFNVFEMSIDFLEEVEFDAWMKWFSYVVKALSFIRTIYINLQTVSVTHLF